MSSVTGASFSQYEKLPVPVAVQHLDPALGDQGTKRTPRRDQLRGRDVPAMSRADDDPPGIGDCSHVVRGQPVAASKDLDKAPPERQRSVRETCSGPIWRYHGNLR